MRKLAPHSKPREKLIQRAVVRTGMKVKSSRARKPKRSEYSSVKLPPLRIRLSPDSQINDATVAGTGPNLFFRATKPARADPNKKMNSMHQIPQRVPPPSASPTASIKNIPGGLFSQAVV